MGIRVELTKLDINDEIYVYYEYENSFFDVDTQKLKHTYGKLKINKNNGDVYTIEYAEGDTGSHARCGSIALIRNWTKGLYPEKAYFES